MRKAAAGSKDAAARPALARAPTGAKRALERRPAAVAWEKLAAPRRARQGIRVGALGVSGAGKTTGVIEFVDYVAELVDVTLIYDIKEPQPQYRGQVVHEADIVLNPPPEGFAEPLVLRRRSFDHEPSIESAGRVTLQASYDGVPTLLVIDELAKAVSPKGLSFTSPSVQRLLSEGRALGASLVWTTQLPQRTPIEAFDQSQLLLFQCGMKALGYLTTQNVIDQRTADVVGTLAVGEFVIVSSGDDFDGVIYQVPPPGPRPAPARAELEGVPGA
jgi:hypothetical protein